MNSKDSQIKELKQLCNDLKANGRMNDVKSSEISLILSNVLKHFQNGTQIKDKENLQIFFEKVGPQLQRVCDLLMEINGHKEV